MFLRNETQTFLSMILYVYSQEYMTQNCVVSDTPFLKIKIKKFGKHEHKTKSFLLVKLEQEDYS